MIETYLVICGLLLAGSVLVRALPMHGASFDEDFEDGWDLDPRELAYLRRGRYGLVLTVLAELHARGSVDLGTRGSVRQLDPPRNYDDPLAMTVYAGLNRCGRPRLLALLPTVRRASSGVRSDLVERALIPPFRRWVFATALVGYAVGLAGATMVERDGRGSTVAGLVVVTGIAAALCLGPRRTLAGRRELRLHRQSLRTAIAAGADDATYLADLVAADGRAAVDVLCGGYIVAGALAPQPEPVRVAAPAQVPAPQLSGLPVGGRSPVYETVSDGPAIVVRRAFEPARERIAA